MSHITVDDEQARIILGSAESVEIRDRSGKHLGYVAHAFTAEEIALARERAASEEPRYTTQEVLQNIQSRERK